MFIVAHELYDALPIHTFKYQGNNSWSEMVIKLEGIDYETYEQNSIIQDASSGSGKIQTELDLPSDDKTNKI